MSQAMNRRIDEAIVAGWVQAYMRRGLLVAGCSVGAAALALAFAPGAPSVGHAFWTLAILALLGLRWALVQQRLRAPALPAEPWLGRMRGLSLLQGAVWGLLAWVGPLPAGADEAAVLIQLQGGAAIGGLALMLSDRRVGVAFALLAGLPLLPRLLAMPGELPLVVPVAGVMFVMLVAGLHAAAGRAQIERRQLIGTRIDEADRREEAQHIDHLLRQVFDHVGEGICLFDGQLRLQAANGRMADLIGLDPALTVPGTPLRDWLLALARAGEYGDVEPQAEAERRLADVTRPVASVARRRRPDGRSIETRRTPLPEGGFAMVCVDVTERVASESALFENKRTLDVLLDNTEEGFWFIDNELRTTDANRAMCRMLGTPREALLGRSIFEFVDAQNEAIFRRQVALRAQGQASSYEIALTRVDGSQVHCWNNATPIHDALGCKIGAIGLFSDISAQKRTSALLAEQSRVLSATLESLSQGVLAVAPDGRLQTWNHRALELLQLPESLMADEPTLQGLTRWQMDQGHFGPGLEHLPGETERSGVRHTLEGGTGRRPASEQYRRRRLDGRTLEILLHRAPDGGEVRTYTDVTAEVESRQALIAARDEAERANRAKSEFLSRMSHELRTPLNAILGFGQLLQHDPVEPLAPGQRTRVDQILQGGRHLLALVNEVLDLARIESGTLPLTLAAVDGRALAAECLGLVAPMAREREVTLAGPEGEAVPLRADAMRLRQVLLNLLSNAIKYGRNGGRVMVRLGAATGGAVRIEVQDDGPGLAPDQQQRLFQVFERLDADQQAVEGAGLGLALSRSLVERMAGRIGVTSAPGQGSCFWVELPAAEPPRPGPKRVLYIEDNEVNQLLMQGMLGDRADLRLEVAGRPELGLEMAAAEPPDLVLLDIQLPGMSGFQVLEKLRSWPALAQVPVIAVSANAMPQDLARAQAAGFDAYLTKPLDLERLREAVDRALALG
jgi:PAS domain S-box-containing protein